MNNMSYKFFLIIVCITSLSLSLYFKLKTGGTFYKMTEQVKRELVKHEIKKRKKDLTVSSLKKSCLNHDKLRVKIKEDLENYRLECFSDFSDSLLSFSLDSLIFVVFDQIHEQAVFKDYYFENGKKIQNIYHKNDQQCNERITMIFEKNSNNQYLISQLVNVPQFFSCICFD